ncbi:uncharacterized protein LOC129798657 [Phlebotomus papatasi]|uniref:uncharacterized protein LOC129798657 n=1 Tax=Phlebotomus papatasi TaxID=29031 RepID=UPI0024845599|nr:uncharacterized protein LOC129798657 [Phlebotomus papatasi]
MKYKCHASKSLDLVKVDHKCLIVSYEFAPRNTSRKWANERDWTEIHSAVQSFIEQKKYQRSSQTEIIDIPGDIQLDIRPKERPSYLAKFFDYPPENLHGNYLAVFVSFGKLQAELERLKAKTNGSKDDEIFVSSQDSEEDTYVPKCNTPKAAVTYTPSKNIKPLDVEEYVPNFICAQPPDTQTQYKATKRKRREIARVTSPDIIPPITDTPRPSTSSVRKSPRTRRPTNILDSQAIFDTSPGDSLPAKEDEEPGTLPHRKSNDLFGSDVTESDIELQETPVPTQEVQKAKKKLILSDWVTRESKDSKEVKEPPKKRDLRIISPTQLVKKKKRKREKEKKKDSGKSPNPPNRQTCSHIPVSRLLSSYRLVEEEMNKVVEEFHRTKRIPKVKDFHYTRYVDLITTEQTNAAMKFLDEKYTDPNENSARLLTVLTEYVLPEWIMRVFMTEYKMNRQEAIDYLLKTEQKAGLEWK